MLFDLIYRPYLLINIEINLCLRSIIKVDPITYLKFICHFYILVGINFEPCNYMYVHNEIANMLYLNKYSISFSIFLLPRVKK